MDMRSIDRRKFITIAGTTGTVAIAGCSGTSDNEDTSVDPGEQEHGGHLRVGVETSPESLNPIQHATAEGYMVTRWLYSNLVNLDTEFNLQPDLATDWSSNEEGDLWTFELRNDATFAHSGEQVTADDVKATIDTIYDDDEASPGNGQFGIISEVRAINDTTVEIDLESPYADVPLGMASQWARILPRDILEDDSVSLTNEAYGSGPFVLEEFEQGDRVVVRRNEDYYNTDEAGNQLPFVDEITMRILPESSARLNAVETNETDIITNVPSDQFERLVSDSDVNTHSTPSGWTYPIIMRLTDEPFDDLRVQHAIKHAMDKEELLEGAARGLGEIGQHNPISSVHRFYEDLEDPFGPGAQIDEAQSLLAEAGYENGLELDFPLYSPSERASEIGQTAVILQDQMSAAGIEFDIEEVTWDRFLSEIEANESFYVSSYGYRVEDETLRLLLHSEGSWNGTQWDNDEFDELVNEAREVPDEDMRQDMYREIQDMTQRDAGMLVPYSTDQLGATASYVQNYDIDPVGFSMPLETVSLDPDAPGR